jgi:threonine dehydrogenase-like Zn-dependent dehydrogenase
MKDTMTAVVVHRPGTTGSKTFLFLNGDDQRPAYTESLVIPGHENVGVIVELDDATRRHWGVEIGDRVVPEQIVPDWTCRYCTSGNYHICKTHNMFGFKRVTPGGMSEYMMPPVESIVHKTDRSIRPEWAVFAEPLSCSLHDLYPLR